MEKWAQILKEWYFKISHIGSYGLEGHREKEAYPVDPRDWNKLFNEISHIYSLRMAATMDMAAALLFHVSQLVIDVDGIHGIYVDPETHQIKDILLGTEFGEHGVVTWQQLQDFVIRPYPTTLGVDSYAIYKMWVRLNELAERFPPLQIEIDLLHDHISRVIAIVESIDQVWVRFTDPNIIIVQDHTPTVSEIVAIDADAAPYNGGAGWTRGKGAIYIDSRKIGKP